jgi:hypothetical protein
VQSGSDFKPCNFHHGSPPTPTTVLTAASVAHAIPQREPYKPSSFDPDSPDYPQDGRACGTPEERARGMIWCDFECVDLNVSPHHCGKCYNWVSRQERHPR